MFNESSDVFANVTDEHRPDRQQPPPMQRQQAPQGMGRSPDGIGGAPAGALAQAGTYGAVGYTGPWEPHDVSPQAAVRTAGVTTLAVAVGFGAGLAAGGWKGGLAGILLTGGLFNGYRAQKWWSSPNAGEKSEAVVSAIMGAVGIGAGGYAAYKAYETKHGKEE